MKCKTYILIFKETFTRDFLGTFKTDRSRSGVELLHVLIFFTAVPSSDFVLKFCSTPRIRTLLLNDVFFNHICLSSYSNSCLEINCSIFIIKNQWCPYLVIANNFLTAIKACRIYSSKLFLPTSGHLMGFNGK